MRNNNNSAKKSVLVPNMQSSCKTITTATTIIKPARKTITLNNQCIQEEPSCKLAKPSSLNTFIVVVNICISLSSSPTWSSLPPPWSPSTSLDQSRYGRQGPANISLCASSAQLGSDDFSWHTDIHHNVYIIKNILSIPRIVPLLLCLPPWPSVLLGSAWGFVLLYLRNLYFKKKKQELTPEPRNCL